MVVGFSDMIDFLTVWQAQFGQMSGAFAVSELLNALLPQTSPDLFSRFHAIGYIFVSYMTVFHAFESLKTKGRSQSLSACNA